MASITVNVSGNTAEFHAVGNEGDLEGSVRVYSDQNYGLGVGGTDALLPFFVFRQSFIGDSYFPLSPLIPGKYIALLTLRNAGEIDYQYFTVTTPTPTPTPTPLNTYELRLYYTNLGWGTVAGLESKLVEIANAINPLIVPLGYTFTNKYSHDTANQYVSLYYQGNSPAIPLAAIAIAVFGILLAIGFALTGAAWYKEADALQTTSETKSTILTQAAADLASGKITPEMYGIISGSLEKLESKEKPTDWTTLLIIGGGIIILASVLPGIIGGKK